MKKDRATKRRFKKDDKIRDAIERSLSYSFLTILLICDMSATFHFPSFASFESLQLDSSRPHPVLAFLRSVKKGAFYAIL